MNVTQLFPGQSGRILQVQGDPTRRLQDLGFVTGARVTKLFVSPAGDPTAYGIGGVTVALRAKDAQKIIVEGPWD